MCILDFGGNRMKPKFTDQYRFPPGGYVPAAATDVAKTFARARREMEKAEDEKRAKVTTISKRRKQV